MKLLFAAPGEYKPIQSVEVGPLIPLQLTVSVPPALTVLGELVRVGDVPPPPVGGGGEGVLPPVVTVKLLVIANRVKPSFAKSRSS